jgi:hypothetical protein
MESMQKKSTQKPICRKDITCIGEALGVPFWITKKLPLFHLYSLFPLTHTWLQAGIGCIAPVTDQDWHGIREEENNGKNKVL